jgi:hypothetical protein
MSGLNNEIRDALALSDNVLQPSSGLLLSFNSQIPESGLGKQKERTNQHHELATLPSKYDTLPTLLLLPQVHIQVPWISLLTKGR